MQKSTIFDHKSHGNHAQNKTFCLFVDVCEAEKSIFSLDICMNSRTLGLFICEQSVHGETKCLLRIAEAAEVL